MKRFFTCSEQTANCDRWMNLRGGSEMAQKHSAANDPVALQGEVAPSDLFGLAMLSPPQSLADKSLIPSN
jgi:hypothetical protein